jgi:hypothetical protein
MSKASQRSGWHVVQSAEDAKAQIEQLARQVEIHLPDGQNVREDTCERVQCERADRTGDDTLENAACRGRTAAGRERYQKHQSKPFQRRSDGLRHLPIDLPEHDVE